MRWTSVLFLLVLSLIPALSGAQATEAGWALLRNGGQVVLLAHADAPGRGDPASFDIEDCRTQRNLSDRGTLQARRIGALFAARAAPVDAIYSSRYCRCLDTAEQAFGSGGIEPLEALDLPAARTMSDEEALREVLALVGGYTGSGNLVLVTHPEVVLHFAGVTPREAEAIIVTADEAALRVIGRIVFN